MSHWQWTCEEKRIVDFVREHPIIHNFDPKSSSKCHDHKIRKLFNTLGDKIGLPGNVCRQHWLCILRQMRFLRTHGPIEFAKLKYADGSLSFLKELKNYTTLQKYAEENVPSTSNTISTSLLGSSTKETLASDLTEEEETPTNQSHVLPNILDSISKEFGINVAKEIADDDSGVEIGDTQQNSPLLVKQNTKAVVIEKNCSDKQTVTYTIISKNNSWTEFDVKLIKFVENHPEIYESAKTIDSTTHLHKPKFVALFRRFAVDHGLSEDFGMASLIYWIGIMQNVMYYRRPDKKGEKTKYTDPILSFLNEDRGPEEGTKHHKVETATSQNIIDQISNSSTIQDTCKAGSTVHKLNESTSLGNTTLNTFLNKSLNKSEISCTWSDFEQSVNDSVLIKTKKVYTLRKKTSTKVICAQNKGLHSDISDNSPISDSPLTGSSPKVDSCPISDSSPNQNVTFMVTQDMIEELLKSKSEDENLCDIVEPDPEAIAGIVKTRIASIVSELEIKKELLNDGEIDVDDKTFQRNIQDLAVEDNDEKVILK